MDFIYWLSEGLAASLIFLIFAMILLQVLFGVLDGGASTFGLSSPGLSVPAYAELSAYMLVAATYMALASALRHEAHVRVTLLVLLVPAGMRRIMEVAAGMIGAAAALYFAWRAGVQAYESWFYGDLSFGLIVIPMWIPQSPMAIGLAILFLAFADYVLSCLRNDWPVHDEADQLGAQASAQGE